MPKSWSLGRSSSQKLQVGKVIEEETHVKRPAGFKISRSRPSSMVSVEFPSSPTISHDGELEKNDNSRQINMNRPSSLYENDQHSGSALNLLSVTQQRDQALRERKDSAASSTSSLIEASSNGDTASLKQTTPARRHISTNTLPSLMKSPSRSSALSSTSTDTNYISASPRPAEKRKEQEGSFVKAQDFASGKKEEISQSTKRTLKDVTNQNGNKSLEKPKHKSDGKEQQTKTKLKSTHSSTPAIDSLYQFRGNQTKNGSKSSIDKSLGSTQHASLVVTSPKLSQNHDEEQPISRPDKQEYPYVVRSIIKNTKTGKKNWIDRYPTRYRIRSKDFDAKQSKALSRYELKYNSGRFLQLSLSQDQRLKAPHQYQYALLDLPVPTYFATDRLTAWAVERASRIASSFIYLFES